MESRKSICDAGTPTSFILILHPTPQLLFRLMANPVTERFERELLGQVAPVPPQAGDDRPPENEPQILQPC
jgi:hypothetical protein